MKKFIAIIIAIAMLGDSVLRLSVVGLRLSPNTANRTPLTAYCTPLTPDTLRPMAEGIKAASEKTMSIKSYFSRHPGKATLIKLMKQYYANTRKIAERLNANPAAVSRWINKDPELKALAKELRKARPGKHPGKENLIQPEAVLYIIETIFHEIDLLKGLAADEIRKKTDLFRHQIRSGQKLEYILPEAFALFCVASDLAIGQKPSPQQVMGAIYLHLGQGVDMKCSEGKTLTIAMASYLNALAGRHVEVHTFDNYLSRRDCQAMGTVFNLLGLSTGAIKGKDSYYYDANYNNVNSPFPDLKRVNRNKSRDEQIKARRWVYSNCDVIYGLGDQFIFDYMYDNTATDINSTVKYGIEPAAVFVDEADSKAIDEALSPLVIGKVGNIKHEEIERIYSLITRIADNLIADKDYRIVKDNLEGRVEWTEQGRERINSLLGEKDLNGAGFFLSPLEILTEALKAKHLIKPGVDFVAIARRAVIVDHFTGRLKPDEKWTGGLQQLVEMRNRLALTPITNNICEINRISYYRALRAVSTLGMISGTMLGIKDLLKEFFDMEVQEIPLQFKSNLVRVSPALVENDIEMMQCLWDSLHIILKTGSSALIFVNNVAESLKIYNFLKDKFNENGYSALLNRLDVLNDTHPSLREAQIIAQLSKPGSVAVATNAAGRGTHIDISEELLEKRGLYVIDTRVGRNKRVAIQRKERTARRSNPGTVITIYSKEDPLLVAYGEAARRWYIDRITLDQLIETVQHLSDSRDKDIIRNMVKYDEALDRVRRLYFKIRGELLRKISYQDNNNLKQTKKLLAEMDGLWEGLLRELSVLRLRDNFSEYQASCEKTHDELSFMHGDTSEVVREAVPKPIGSLSPERLAAIQSAA